ncbi:ssDNA endodeoxyribonuclease RAD2 NDAI_0B00870 [Naumovozyma dairenensis CBS 421]|uniref:DNA repair protein RAD2 n=1 Tax=Naumovozyma dairenensis (strain ATCC 10597 / BCRC 20456 / CBS 421 / NBRC 0211 / NRRL Y-12639) TaxID=1071378 RepID=G0W5R0_NAUDC|nr:hypothetical protein NDAI_0B00870 [Naumovozyma dairenensis CBS 421]CCD23121.1 hypothetical protein NDAI_0B00870 [Naumovozyma dairenensis CBS 421]
MGVHSFWDVVARTSKPVRLESLQDKKMAIDASIWIYQFLKAVRDENGNKVKNSHITGFFRRICKLLYFGIKPVFVFDGGVPVLKRETIRQRREIRQGKRDDASRTAKKILALQLLQKNNGTQDGQTSPGKKKNESTKTTKNTTLFKPDDDWDLPEIEGFKYDLSDQRVNTAKKFENVISNMDDELDTIDLDSINPASKEFEELPKSTQYMVLSTLRLRSRLRMGYTKEQLEDIFPNSLDFSKFQINMVKRRNFYTQKLMNVTGLHDSGASKLNDEVINRISGQLHKEYKLQKTENGWALGLGEMDGSEVQKAIILDKPSNNTNTEVHTQVNDTHTKSKSSVPQEVKTEDEDEEDEFDWEDVDLKANKEKEVEDFSLSAARLPKLDEVRQAVGSQSFLDTRPNQVSPLKKSQRSIIRHVDINDESDHSDNDEDYLDQIEEIEMMEAYQKSLLDARTMKAKKTNKIEDSEKENIAEQQTKQFLATLPDEILSKEKTVTSKSINNVSSTITNDVKVLPPVVPQINSNATHPNLTETEQNLNFIVGKIPNSSFLFQSPTREIINEVDESVSEKEEEKKLPPPEVPAWFQTVSNVEATNPFTTSNFVQDKKIADLNSNEKNNNNADGDFKLVSGFDAEDLLEVQQNSAPLIEDDTLIEEVQPTTNIETKEDSAENNDIGESTTEKPQKRKPLIFNYDFSDEEEENLTENIRKEQQEFEAFKDLTLLNGKASGSTSSLIDKAFMEDELYEQQMKDKRDSDEVTPDMVQDVQDLLSRFGIPFIVAPMEAEAQCAELLHLNLVDGIVTDDSDVFLFGGSKVYKNMFHEKNYVEFYDSASILRNIGLDRINMIEMAQLLGSDYTNGVKGMGPVSSLEIIAEFGNLRKFKEWYEEGQFNEKKQENESKFEKDLRKRLVKNEIVFDSNFPSELVKDAYLNPEVDHDKTKFIWNFPDLDLLREFLKRKIGWPQEKSDEVLIPLIQDINKRKKQGKQRSISDFFPSEYLEGSNAMNMSKRLATAAGKMKKRRME